MTTPYDAEEFEFLNKQMDQLGDDDPTDSPTGGGQQTDTQQVAGTTAQTAPLTGKKLLDLPIDDDGNAQAVNALYPGQFLHSDSLGSLHWTGAHWETQGAEAAMRNAITEMLRERTKAAWDSGLPNTHKELLKFCVPNRNRIQGAEFRLRDLNHVDITDFDTNPDLLNCANGVVNLRTGKITPHNSNQRFTYSLQLPYNPNADSSYWTSWLIGEVGPEVADYLRLAVGYTLTGHTREEVFFYLYGPPRSGKGTFTETLLLVFGRKPLAQEVTFDTFTAERTGDTQNFDLAPLKACRLILASESKGYEKLNEAAVKRMTGGNDITCAPKYGNFFSYRPQFKIWLSSNHPVKADPNDDAVWGRVRTIGFLNSYLGREDKTIKDRMKSQENLEGVLAWAISGAMDWYKLGAKGLHEPDRGKALKDEQRAAQDYVRQWLDECCEFEPSYSESSSRAYDNYARWCIENGFPKLGGPRFKEALGFKGYEYQRTTTRRFYVGFRLAPIATVPTP